MSDIVYYIGHIDGSPADKVSRDELEAKIQNGTVTVDALICRSGWSEWKKCGELEEFRHLFAVPREAKPVSSQSPVPNYSLMGAFLSCLIRYAQFRGRACRTEFWKFALAAVLISTLAVILADFFEDSYTVAIIACAIPLFLFVPLLAVTSRRLHDTGKTSLWMLAFLGCSGAGGLTEGVLRICLSVCALVCLISVFRRSEPANRFGKAPEESLDMQDVRLHMTGWKRKPVVYGLALSILLSAAFVLLCGEPYMQEVYECLPSGMGETEKRELYERVCSAADDGNAEAECAKGFCLLYGIGTNQDENQAFECFHLSAEHGYARANAYMASCYAEGFGVEENPTEAFRLAQLAAQKGDLQGYVILGLLHAKGIGCEQNPRMAVQLFHAAADMGYSEGIFWLAQCYAEGFGVEKDLQKARELLQPLAEAGYEGARQLLIALDKQ